MAEYITKEQAKSAIKKRLGTMDLFESRFNEDIDAISTADVAEVVHAKWKPKYNKEDGYWHNVCSACKTESVFEYEYEPDYDEGLDGEWHYIDQMECGIREHLTTYCPNCGAKMDGERRDTDETH